MKLSFIIVQSLKMPSKSNILMGEAYKNNLTKRKALCSFLLITSDMPLYLESSIRVNTNPFVFYLAFYSEKAVCYDHRKIVLSQSLF